MLILPSSVRPPQSAGAQPESRVLFAGRILLTGASLDRFDNFWWVDVETAEGPRRVRLRQQPDTDPPRENETLRAFELYSRFRFYYVSSRRFSEWRDPLVMG